MAHGDFKDLNRKTVADKVLRDKNPKYDGIQRGFPSMVYNLFHKKTSGRTVENEIISNKELPITQTIYY